MVVVWLIVASSQGYPQKHTFCPSYDDGRMPRQATKFTWGMVVAAKGAVTPKAAGLDANISSRVSNPFLTQTGAAGQQI